MAHDPQTEILPPISQSYGQTTYAPAEPPVREHRSEWDPRSAPGTYILLALNILVFLWMVLHGVSWMNPTLRQLVYYGANNSALDLYNHQWYRLLTATFVHIGIIHIATNMWCLWNLGLLGEPLIGPLGLVAVYVLTGVAGNLLSVAWDVLYAYLRHVPVFYVATTGAGASGAVFGITGILIVLLSNKRLPIPWPELKRLRTSVVRFAVINLLIGGATIFAGPIRIDNSAHVGGFLCGLALGPALVPSMTSGRARYLARQRVVFIAAAFLLALVGSYLANVKQP